MGPDGDANAGGQDAGHIVVLAIAGMHCQSCAALIEETLVEDLGVTGAEVDLRAARATIRYDPAVHGLDDLCVAVEAAGYQATPIEA